MRADHPRSRGEHGSSTGADNREVGSPPLARGARGASDDGADTRRITPARAGSTRLPFRTRPRRPDHPRSRGEHTTRRPPAPWPEADHPRSRGEHMAARADRVNGGGSPPLARGAQRDPTIRFHVHRITPARAGSTQCPSGSPDSFPDHPRSRGEHGPQGLQHRGQQGSPPLARGAPPGFRHLVLVLRITPARAGSTPCRAGPWPPSSDHPRSRGEHIHMLARTSAPAGSPPLARGAPVDRGPDLVVFRITPARAGSTSTG